MERKRGEGCGRRALGGGLYEHVGADVPVRLTVVSPPHGLVVVSLWSLRSMFLGTGFDTKEIRAATLSSYERDLRQHGLSKTPT